MDSVPTQPAISSMASGSPSSLRQSSPIACGGTSAAEKPGSRSLALAMNSRTASEAAISRRARGDRGAVKRGDGPAHLARHPEHDLAGDHDAQVRRRGEELAGQPGHLLAVVFGTVE